VITFTETSEILTTEYRVGLQTSVQIATNYKRLAVNHRSKHQSVSNSAKLSQMANECRAGPPVVYINEKEH